MIENIIKNTPATIMISSINTAIVCDDLGSISVYGLNLYNDFNFLCRCQQKKVLVNINTYTCSCVYLVAIYLPDALPHAMLYASYTYYRRLGGFTPSRSHLVRDTTLSARGCLQSWFRVHCTVFVQC